MESKMKKLLFLIVGIFPSYLISNFCANVRNLNWIYGDGNPYNINNDSTFNSAYVSLTGGFNPLSLCVAAPGSNASRCCPFDDQFDVIEGSGAEFTRLVGTWQNAMSSFFGGEPNPVQGYGLPVCSGSQGCLQRPSTFTYTVGDLGTVTMPDMNQCVGYLASSSGKKRGEKVYCNILQNGAADNVCCLGGWNGPSKQVPSNQLVNTGESGASGATYVGDCTFAPQGQCSYIPGQQDWQWQPSAASTTVRVWDGSADPITVGGVWCMWPPNCNGPSSEQAVYNGQANVQANTMSSAITFPTSIYHMLGGNNGNFFVIITTSNPSACAYVIPLNLLIGTQVGKNYTFPTGNFVLNFNNTDTNPPYLTPYKSTSMLYYGYPKATSTSNQKNLNWSGYSIPAAEGGWNIGQLVPQVASGKIGWYNYGNVFTFLAWGISSQASITIGAGCNTYLG